MSFKTKRVLEEGATWHEEPTPIRAEADRVNNLTGTFCKELVRNINKYSSSTFHFVIFDRYTTGAYCTHLGNTMAFTAATAVEQTSTHTYTANFEDDWCIGRYIVTLGIHRSYSLSN